MGRSKDRGGALKAKEGSGMEKMGGWTKRRENNMYGRRMKEGNWRRKRKKQRQKNRQRKENGKSNNVRKREKNTKEKNNLRASIRPGIGTPSNRIIFH